MKTKVLSLIGLLLLSTIVLFATQKSEKFKVYGNCSMCENRIEAATMNVDGIVKADWNSETKMIEVTYDESATNLVNIQLAINNAGHDTEMYIAEDEYYNDLPGCCKYERSKSIKGVDSPHNKMNSGCKRPQKSSSKGSCCNKNM